MDLRLESSGEEEAHMSLTLGNSTGRIRISGSPEALEQALIWAIEQAGPGNMRRRHTVWVDRLVGPGRQTTQDKMRL